MSELIPDPKADLSKKKLEALCSELVAAVAWNASPAGIKSQLGRGYSASGVVSGMIGDILQKGSEHGVDIVDAVFWALAMHDSYGRRQCDEARAAGGALANQLKSSFSRDHAVCLQQPVRRSKGAG